MTIGERIKKVRQNLGLTLEEVADAASTGRATIYKYENGLITNIPSDKIEAIAKVLHVLPAYLMGWTNEDEGQMNFPYAKEWNKISGQDIDPDIRRIERARKNMPEKDKEKMMRILRASFDEYFDGDFEDDDIDE